MEVSTEDRWGARAAKAPVFAGSEEEVGWAVAAAAVLALATAEVATTVGFSRVVSGKDSTEGTLDGGAQGEMWQVRVALVAHLAE